MQDLSLLYCRLVLLAIQGPLFRGDHTYYLPDTPRPKLREVAAQAAAVGKSLDDRFRSAVETHRHLHPRLVLRAAAPLNDCSGSSPSTNDALNDALQLSAPTDAHTLAKGLPLEPRYAPSLSALVSLLTRSFSG